MWNNTVVHSLPRTCGRFILPGRPAPLSITLPRDLRLRGLRKPGPRLADALAPPSGGLVSHRSQDGVLFVHAKPFGAADGCATAEAAIISRTRCRERRGEGQVGRADDPEVNRGLMMTLDATTLVDFVRRARMATLLLVENGQLDPSVIRMRTGESRSRARRWSVSATTSTQGAFSACLRLVCGANPFSHEYKPNGGFKNRDNHYQCLAEPHARQHSPVHCAERVGSATCRRV